MLGQHLMRAMLLSGLMMAAMASHAHDPDSVQRAVLPLNANAQAVAWADLASRRLHEHSEHSLNLGLDFRINRRLSLFVGAHACRWSDAGGRTLDHEDARAGLRIWLSDSR